MDEDIIKMLRSLPHETYNEVYIGRVDLERLDGTILKDMDLMCKEKLYDDDDIESIYEREYYVENGNEEIFVGDDKGKTIILKEQL